MEMNRLLFLVTINLLLLIPIAHADGHTIAPVIPPSASADADPSHGNLPEPITYGLFVGVRHGDIRGDLDAESFWRQLLYSSLIKPGDEILLMGDYEAGGITTSRIEGALRSLRLRVKPRDRLIVFLSAHGFNESQGDEHSGSPGDEYLAFHQGSHFTDDRLSSLLAGMDDVEKWVMIDACRSGGFWSANEDGEGDAGDMDRLKNVSLFAAAGEKEDSYADEAGRGYFTAALIRAFESEELLTFDSLEESIRQSAEGDGLDERPAYLRSLGYIVDLPLDTWEPLAFKSEDFLGALGCRGVAEPTNWVFLCCGLAGIVSYRRLFGSRSRKSSQSTSLLPPPPDLYPESSCDIKREFPSIVGDGGHSADCELFLKDPG